MTGPSPWSVKGIDRGTRDVARHASRRAGLTIGAWIDRTIRRSTVEPPRAAEQAPVEPPARPISARPTPAGPIPAAPTPASAAAGAAIFAESRPAGRSGAATHDGSGTVDYRMSTAAPDAPGPAHRAPAAGAADAPGRLAETVAPVSRAVDELARRLAALEETRRRRGGAAVEAGDDDEPTRTIPLPPAPEPDDEDPTIVREPYAERARTTGRSVRARPGGRPRARGGWRRQAVAALGGLVIGALVTGGGLHLLASGAVPVDPSVRASVDEAIDPYRPRVRSTVDDLRASGEAAWRAGREGGAEAGRQATEWWHAALGLAGLEDGSVSSGRDKANENSASRAGSAESGAGSASSARGAPAADQHAAVRPPAARDERHEAQPSAARETTSVARQPGASGGDRATADQTDRIEAGIYERLGIDPGLPRAERDDLVAAWYRRRAESGDAGAQYVLALLYAQGRGVRRDFGVAAEWLREAALQGETRAQYHLGLFYENGLGVPKDDIRALLWYHSAADKGDARAQYNLGVFYATGRGIPQDYAEARKWFERADAAGLAAATFALGQIYEDGLGVAPDGARAIDLYERAAQAGNEDAMQRLASLRPGSAPPPAHAPAGEGAPADVVAAVQQMLTALGYRPGPVDGKLSEETRAAIAAYQRASGLEATGDASEALLDHMIATVSSGQGAPAGAGAGAAAGGAAGSRTTGEGEHAGAVRR